VKPPCSRPQFSIKQTLQLIGDDGIVVRSSAE
jgi:hypothetical protein